MTAVAHYFSDPQ